MIVAVVAEPAIRPSHTVAAFEPVGTILGSVQSAQPEKSEKPAVEPEKPAVESEKPAVKPGEADEGDEAASDGERGGGLLVGGRLHHAAQAAAVQRD